MTKQVGENDIQYHIGLSTKMIQGAEYVLLPGDPQRVEPLAKAFDSNARPIGNNREYLSFLANLNNGRHVLICSTGIGGPSLAIAVEELATIGLKYFIRVGTCGGIQHNTHLGDVIISQAAVRLDGTSQHYAPIEYPAVASLSLTNACVKAAEELQAPYHVGITASSDTFWPGQERYDNYSGYLLRRFRGSMAEWTALNVLNFEMEAATLLTVCKVFGLEAACLCVVIAKRDESESVIVEVKKKAKEILAKVAVRSIQIDMENRY